MVVNKTPTDVGVLLICTLPLEKGEWLKGIKPKER